MTPERGREVERIYRLALAWEPGKRAEFLQQACHDDPELRAEVEALLAAQDPLRTLIEQPEPSPRQIRIHPGAHFGCYRIEALLGEGGMGGVYRAVDVKLGREVAFKVPFTSVSRDPDALRRFQDEARLASSLNHPNIVTIYAVGEERGVVYIAMELVRGRTLARLLSEGPLSVPKAVDLAVQLAAALEAAHAQHIIHRDLKPANIIVAAEDRIKVLDFGLAKRNSAHAHAGFASFDSNKVPATESGVVLGTAGYMSPEQASGQPATHAADQFAFGAILYEMLTGSRAFSEPTAVETLAAIIRQHPQSPRSLNPLVPFGLQAIVERCLAKNPADRYADTAELRRELSQVYSPAVVLPTVKHTLSRRQVIGLGLGTAGVPLGAAAWKLRPGSLAIRFLAVLPFENASNDPDAEFLCDGLTDSLIRQISRLRPLMVKPRNSVIAFKGKVVDPQAAGRQLRVDAIVTGSVMRHNNRLSIRADLVDVNTGAVLWSERYDRDQSDLLQIQDQIASAVVNEGIRMKLGPEDRRRLTHHPTENLEANELYMRARSHHDKETEADYLTARQLLLQALAKDGQFSLAYWLLASNYAIMTVDGYSQPAGSWPMVLTYARKALAFDPELDEAHFELASEAFWNQRNWALAEQEFATASRRPEAPLTMAYPLERWAVGHPEDALRLIARARQLEPLNPAWRVKEADMLLTTGQTERSAVLYGEIIRDLPEDGRAYFGLAEARRRQGRFEDAIQSLRQGYRAVDEDDESLTRLMENAQGETGYRMIEAAGAALELQTLESEKTGHYVSPLDFARAYARLGRKQEALRSLEHAIAERAPGLVFLKVDRVWDPIREDADFVSIVRRLGLP